MARRSGAVAISALRLIAVGGSAVCRLALLLLLAGLVLPACGHGDLHERIEELSGRIAANPTPDLYFQRANLHFNHGDADAALLDLAWIDQHAPATLETDPLRAQALLLSGRDQAALITLNRYLKLHPQAASCLALRAQTRCKLGDTKAAIIDYQAAIALDPRSDPDLILAAAAALVADKRGTEAIRTLDAASTRLGPVPGLALKALEIEIQAENWDAALARCATLQASAPRPEPWMARRATILTQAGRPDAANQAWRDLLDHLSLLPPAERDSTAMSRIAADARRHLATQAPPPATD